MKLQEIANRIQEHLRRFEADPVINQPDHKGHVQRLTPYFQAGAWMAGSGVKVTYVRFQGSSFLKKFEAEGYLAWLESGNIGKHWLYLRKQAEAVNVEGAEV